LHMSRTFPTNAGTTVGSSLTDLSFGENFRKNACIHVQDVHLIGRHRFA
jgi:hypothetical protein